MCHRSTWVFLSASRGVLVLGSILCFPRNLQTHAMWLWLHQCKWSSMSSSMHRKNFNCFRLIFILEQVVRKTISTELCNVSCVWKISFDDSRMCIVSPETSHRCGWRHGYSRNPLTFRTIGCDSMRCVSTQKFVFVDKTIVAASMLNPDDVNLFQSCLGWR